MKNHSYHIVFLLLLLVFLGSKSAWAQFYNGTQTEFGQNRVQYDDFEWQFFRFEKFETYFYTGGKDLAVHTSRYVNQHLSKHEKFLDFTNDERLQFIVYNKQSHFRQSNIGLSSSESYNIGGVTNIVGNKVFLYFNGDFEEFNRQIDAGIYKVLIYQMIYGGNWREVLRNSALLHLPEWYIQGLVSYLSDPENPIITSRIKDGIINNDFKRFNSLSNDEALIAGHAMWQYISEIYGINVLSNILYMTRISRNLDDGFLYVLGVSFEDLYANWLMYNQNKLNTAAKSKEIQLGNAAPFKIRKNRKYQNFKESPAETHYCFSTNKLGQYKIYIYDKIEDKTKKIFSGEHKLDRIQDYSFPILNWHPSGKILSFIIEKKGLVLLYNYEIETEELSFKPVFKMEKVLSFDYSKDGKQIVFSGVTKGQSDLFLYNVLGNTQKNLTNDVYDDKDPKFINNDQQIIFSSSRVNDSITANSQGNNLSTEKDIFLFDLNKKGEKISSITNTPDLDEFNPLKADDQLYFLSNSNGETYRNTAIFDSTISHIDTMVHYNYFYNISNLGKSSRNLIELNATKSISEFTNIAYLNGSYFLGIENGISAEESKPNEETKPSKKSIDSPYFDYSNARKFKKFSPDPVEKNIDVYSYQFETNQNTIPIKESTISESNTEIIEELKFPTQRLYRLNFKPDNSVIQLNNAFMNGQYQIFNGGPFTNPGVGVNTKIGIVDLMEDHRIYGGIRLSGNVTEYSLNYQNLKDRLDKEYSISRRKERSTQTIVPYDIKTLQASYSLKWPFSEVSSIRATSNVRNDKIIPLAGDINSLRIPVINEYWASLKSAYVFDNTRNVALNIRYGTRFKFFFEQYQLINSSNDNTQSSDLSVFGFDFRHYQEVHKEIIFVTRLAGSKSFGSNPLIYYLGGVDEWWKSNLFDDGTPIDFSQNYGFQALAANMRGFLQNIRNGNNFMVMNNELRVPIFSYLINRPIQSDFVRNFQLIGFGDVGTAWVGNSPFADDNPINNETRKTGPITITYENINDPIVGGFGFGLRTTLLGYFMRADWGWGVENGIISDKPLFIFSLSLDI